jgi:predicted membrane protein
MNEEFKPGIERKWGKRRSENRILAGLMLLIIGGLLLLNTLHLIVFPPWFFTWPMIIIAIGLFGGLRHNFKGGFWIILLLFGIFSLANDINPSLNIDRFIAPFIIIAIGLLFILRPKRNHWRKWNFEDRGSWRSSHAIDENTSAGNVEEHNVTDRSDFIDITAVFGGVKKNILSKNFKGGDIVSFMGGSEINLSQADINGRVVIDTNNIFGGTKLIVPSSWDVQSDVTAIFGGVDDKRQVIGVNMDPNKVLILDGTCIFGGIEIRSF